jgi:hypothetical protein
LDGNSIGAQISTSASSYAAPTTYIENTGTGLAMTIASGGIKVPTTKVYGDYILGASEYLVDLQTGTTSNLEIDYTVYLPSVSAKAGLTYKIVNNGLSRVQVQCDGSDSMGNLLGKFLSPEESIEIVSDGVSNWNITSHVRNYGQEPRTYTAINATYSVLYGDKIIHAYNTTGSPTYNATYSIYLPYNQGYSGMEFTFKNREDGTITITSTHSTALIDGTASIFLSKDESATIISANDGWIIISSGETDTGTDNKTPQILVDAATISWTYSIGYNAEVTINSNRSLSISGATAGDYGTLKIIQGSSSNYRINFGTSSNRFPNGTYSFSTTQGRWDIYGFYYDGTYFNWSFNKNYY